MLLIIWILRFKVHLQYLMCSSRSGDVARLSNEERTKKRIRWQPIVCQQSLKFIENQQILDVEYPRKFGTRSTQNEPYYFNIC